VIRRRPRQPAGARDRAGFTLLELTLSLVITAFVGLGIASMMNMVASSESMDRDSRSVLLRSHAAQLRLRSYLGPALNVLAHDPARGLAIWLHDEKPQANVHLSELRVLWWNAGAGTLRIERVDWPDAWPQSLIDENDVILPPGTDYFAAMAAQRLAGLTAAETVLEELAAFTVEYDTAAATDASVFRVTLTISTDVVTRDVLMTFGLAEHNVPNQ